MDRPGELRCKQTKKGNKMPKLSDAAACVAVDEAEPVQMGLPRLGKELAARLTSV